MELDISTESADAGCTIALTGEVDVYTSPRLREELSGAVEAGCLHIIVAMDGVDFIDSSGLGVLVSALRRVKEQGGTLRLVCTKEAILKILRITGLDKVFPLFTTVEEAQEF
jgi:anti-sigma B factor antagonist